MKTVNFEEAVIPKLLKEWEALERSYLNQFAVSSLAKYYREIFKEEIEWNKEKIVDALIAHDLEHRKDEGIADLQFSIELAQDNLDKLNIY